MKSAMVLDLVRAHANRSDTDFKKTLDEMIDHEIANGNLSLSVSLRKASIPKPGVQIHKMDPVFGEGFSEFISAPKYTFDDVVMSAETSEHIDTVLDEFSNRSKLLEHGLTPTSKILLYGPPGCGKTMVAHAIAERLGMLVCTLRFDTLISQFMGQTANNIGRLFDWARSRNVLLFIDEIDAIARLRDFDNDNGESKRIVVSLIQNIDNLGDDIVVATNMFGQIDSAVVRRFQDVIEMGLPDLGQRTKIIDKFIQKHSVVGHVDANSLALLSEGLNGSDLTNILTRMLKDAVMSGIELGSEGNPMFESYMKAKYGREYTKDDVYGELKILRNKGVKLKELHEMTSIPTSTLCVNLKGRCYGK